jgi:drug/metabolite transporter (DMT)-like permease
VVVAVLSVTVAVGLLPVALWVWQPVTGVQLAWLAAVAALATLGHYTMTRAFSAAPLAVTQPVVFLQLLWASLLGALVFGEPVDGFVILGGAMIVAAVSLNTWSEAQRETVPPQPEA